MSRHARNGRVPTAEDVDVVKNVGAMAFEGELEDRPRFCLDTHSFKYYVLAGADTVSVSLISVRPL